MNPILIFIIGAILGAVAGWFFARRGLKQHFGILQNARVYKEGNEGEEKKETLIEKQSREKEENKKKILEFMKSKEKITNNNVEKLLGVSNATAERYLDELEKEGILKQVGKIGQSVYYALKHHRAMGQCEKSAEKAQQDPWIKLRVFFLQIFIHRAGLDYRILSYIIIYSKGIFIN